MKKNHINIKKFLFHSFFVLISSSFVSTSFAQEKVKVKELGLNFTGLNSYGFRYKCGNEKRLFRITTLSLNGTLQDSKFDTLARNYSSTSGFGLNIGFEKRIRITDNLFFIHGLDLLNSFATRVDLKNKNQNGQRYWSLSPGIGFVVGALYEINNKFNLSAELVPSVIYRYSETVIVRTSGNRTHSYESNLSMNLNNANANLTLAYRL